MIVRICLRTTDARVGLSGRRPVAEPRRTEYVPGDRFTRNAPLAFVVVVTVRLPSVKASVVSPRGRFEQSLPCRHAPPGTAYTMPRSPLFTVEAPAPPAVIAGAPMTHRSRRMPERVSNEIRRRGTDLRHLLQAPQSRYARARWPSAT